VVKAENLLSKKFFSPPLKIWWKKTSNLPQISEDYHQSEVHHFIAAQHIDKQITDVLSMINALKMVPNLGASPHIVLMQLREKIAGTLIPQNVNKPISGHGTHSSSVNK